MWQETGLVLSAQGTAAAVLFWVPAELIGLAQTGINVNVPECIQWFA
jgi:hypothetical protein